MAGSGSPIYVLVNRDLLEVQLADLPDVIDFGQQGLRVNKSQFVGVRYVGPGVVVETPKPPSSHHAVTEVLKGILGGRKHSPEQDINSVHSGIRPLVVPELLMDHPDSPVKKIQWIKTTTHARNGDSKYHMEHNQNTGSKEYPIKGENGQAPKEFRAPLHFFQEAGYNTWELVWKEGKAGGPLKKLKFVTTEAGYRYIQDKLDAWASAAHASVAMNEAARAALDACGGQLKENPGHTERSASFKRRNKPINHLDQADTHGGDSDKPAAQVLTEDQYIINLETLQLHGRLQPVCDSKSQIVDDRHIKALAAVLPVRFRSYKWTLLYNTDRDGISLNTLYRKVHLKGPTLLLIRDRQKHVFGCYASEEWKVTARMYGTGECFVFQISPGMKAYKWTHANNMFMQSNQDYLAIGGGDHYSVMLDSDLLTGCSGPCVTFGSPCLASSDNFEVSMVEVWGFQ
ncbi:hypothetical protein Mapa_011375 [Marchantia paleacea]|nr:hypothetical protein Mapa_011375 [Marchantia paleacea]